MYSKVVLLKESKGGEEEGKKYGDNNEIHHICVGTRHKGTC
jgi:hypothetical protein